jgi:hypothetical protein
MKMSLGGRDQAIDMPDVNPAGWKTGWTTMRETKKKTWRISGTGK